MIGCTPEARNPVRLLGSLWGLLLRWGRGILLRRGDARSSGEFCGRRRSGFVIACCYQRGRGRSDLLPGQRHLLSTLLSGDGGGLLRGFSSLSEISEISDNLPAWITVSVLYHLDAMQGVSFPDITAMQEVKHISHAGE